ncbi:MAG TPA: mitochondrial fission ELM1 family protein [Hyphomonadaceae bacterium]|nr:mitochondrial fission ELM1 family protein [Hyphomonadaceae bacterium]HPI49255.1 mitochondrial fission ELM1 family protein [Hyphomonadaceae bacterium]
MSIGPSVWCVADGRAGILNQTKALAAALAEPERAAKLAHIRSDAASQDVILQPQGFQLMLRPDLWPMPLSALPAEQRKLLTPPWPDVWIAAGRRSIPYSRVMRKLSGDKTLVVQTQDPKVSLSSFDLVIPPEHDAVAGTNVLSILGSPVWFSSERIGGAKQQFGHLLNAAGQKVLVSLGGDSKTHRFTEARAAAIEADLRRLADDRKFWITVSRRTPEAIRNRFRKLATELDAVFWESEQRDGPNPYVAFLSLCDAALVTEDSANMLADPAFFAKPIHVLKLEGSSPRFDRLHQGFIAAGAARWFDGGIQTWAYQPIREAARAADEIVRLLLKRHANR